METALVRRMGQFVQIEGEPDLEGLQTLVTHSHFSWVSFFSGLEDHDGLLLGRLKVDRARNSRPAYAPEGGRVREFAPALPSCSVLGI